MIHATIHPKKTRRANEMPKRPCRCVRQSSIVGAFANRSSTTRSLSRLGVKEHAAIPDFMYTRRTKPHCRIFRGSKKSRD